MKKIDVLKKAIEKLEGGIKYNWNVECHCNMGIIAQCSMGVDAKKLQCLLLAEEGSWCGKMNGGGREVCPITGIPIHEVYNQLRDDGFTKEEIVNAELLGNEEILKRAKITPIESYYMVKENLISYLKAWVEILEEQQPRPAMIQPSDKVRRVYVTVDKEIRKLETNLN